VVEEVMVSNLHKEVLNSAEMCLLLQDEIARKNNNCRGFENRLVSCLMMLVFFARTICDR